MSLVSVAIVSKDNKPLYLKDFRGSRDITESDEFMSVDMFDLAREASNSVSQSAPASSPASDGTGAGAGGSTVPLDAEIGKSCSIDQQFILHSALDRLEQLMEPNGLGAAWRYGRNNQLGNEAMFVGLIGHVDDLRLYAYITTTKIKIIVACEDAFLPGQADQGRAHDVALKNLMVSDLLYNIGNRSTLGLPPHVPLSSFKHSTNRSKYIASTLNILPIHSPTSMRIQSKVQDSIMD